MNQAIKLLHINHVVTVCKDIKRSMEFYCGLLGISQIKSQVDDPNIVWLQLPSGVMLHLIGSSSSPAFPHNIHHAFEVTNIDITTSILEENGITIERYGTRNDGQRFIFFRDPDGNLVEICTESGF